MERLAAIFLAGFFGFLTAKADFAVKFDTSTLPNGRRVLSGWEPATGSNLFAQLFHAPAGVYPINWTPVGSAVRLGAGSGAPPGTWKGPDVILSGVEDGQPALLTVFVWDRLKYGSWQSANKLVESFGHPQTKPDTGWSDAFEVRHEPGSPSSATLENFPGIILKTFCALLPPPPAGDVVCDENSAVVLLQDTWGVNSPGDFSLWLLSQAAPTTIPGLQLGSLSEPPNRLGSTYTANANTYGEDRVYQYRQGGFCDPPRWTATLLKIQVRPSPLRPYLATKLNGNQHSLVLRGLDGRKYRLQRSTNLITWENRNEVIGNTSEVALPDTENDGVESRFYRVLDVTNQ